MKSILALLCIVAVSNAFIAKNGGLKGSWTESVEVTSATPDIEAPTVDYYYGDILDLSYDYYNFYSTYEINTSFGYNDEDYNYLYVDFDAEDDSHAGSYGAYNYGGSDCMFWAGESMAAPTATLWPDFANSYVDDPPCQWDSDGEFTCTFYLPSHLIAGEYKLYCLLWDLNGNVAEVTPDSFGVDDQPAFTLYENDPDTQAPVVAGFALTEATVALDGTGENDDTNAATPTITVTIQDGEWEEAANYDPFSSQISESSTGVWATLCQVCDEEGSDDVSFMLWYAETDENDGTQTWEIRFFFGPLFEPSTWTVKNVWARDTAGNVGIVEPTTGNVITITYNEDALDDAGGVFSCQDLTVSETTLSTDEAIVVVTATSGDTATVWGNCVEKDESGYNYVVVAYQSEPYTPTSPSSEEQVFTVWDYTTSYALSSRLGTDSILDAFGIAYSYNDADYDTDYLYQPGTYTVAGYFSTTLVFPSAIPAGDYWLYEVYTITDTGGVQKYSLAEGAASSVAPSLFAVAVAATVALFRL